MLKTATYNLQPRQISEQMMAASRQVWLASLGAAVVTREWAQKEAGQTLKTLVREGTAVESKAIRYVGDQIEAQMTRANSMWKQTRRTVESTVKQAAEQTVALAQQVLPHSPLLPAIRIPGFTKRAMPAKPAKRAVKRAKKAAVAAKPRVAKKAKRATKAAALA
jgi:hypothetical protein